MTVYKYRIIETAPYLWAIHRAWGSTSAWVSYATTDNKEDAERIVAALELLDEEERTKVTSV